MAIAALSGKLGNIFFPELIHQIRADRASGVLRVNIDTLRKAVFFENGLMVFAISNLKHEQLEQALVAKGLVTTATLDATPGLDRGKRLAASLVETNLLPWAEVVKLVHGQILEIIHSLFDREEGEFSFDERVRADHEIKLMTPPGDIILEGVRRIKNPEFFKRALCNGEALLAPATQAELKYQGLSFSPTEAYIFTKIDQQIRVRDLISIAGLPEVETLRAAYGLAAAGMFVLTRLAPIDPEVFAQVKKNDNGPSKEELAKLRADIMQATHVFSADDYYEVLGVSRQAQGSEIKRVYYQLAKRFHPDRSHMLGDTLLQERLEKIFQRISEAYETLASPDQRSAYDEKIGAPKPGKVPVQPVRPTSPAAPANVGAPTRQNTPGARPAPPPSRQTPPPMSIPVKQVETQPAPESKVKPQRQTEPKRSETATPMPAMANQPRVVVTVTSSTPGKSDTRTPIQMSEYLAQQASLAFNRNDIVQAVELLRQAVQADPENNTLRLNLTKLLQRNQRWHKEIEDHYLYLIKREPYNENFHMMLGRHYKTQGQKAKAEGVFKNVLQLNPAHGGALRELANQAEQDKPARSGLVGEVGGMFNRLFKR